MPHERPAVATHVLPADMLAAMSDAWILALGGGPKHEAICTLVAQWALETGGGRSCMNSNIGNFKASPDGAYDFTYFTTYERVSPDTARAQVEQFPTVASWDGVIDADGKARLVVRPLHPWCCFRAYESLAVACADYLHSMYTRFEHAWSAACAGDPVAFAKELGAAGYYTSSSSDYAKGCLEWFQRLMEMPWTAPPVSSSMPSAVQVAVDASPDSEPEGAA